MVHMEAMWAFQNGNLKPDGLIHHPHLRLQKMSQDRDPRRLRWGGKHVPKNFRRLMPVQKTRTRARG